MSLKKIITKVLLFTLVICFSLNSLSCNLSSKREKLEKEIASMKQEFIPMKFEVQKYYNDNINVTLAFYDINGKKVASHKNNLTGSELFIDLDVQQLDQDKYLFFPYGIYSNTMAPIDSIRLSDYYKKGNFPSIYKGIGESAKSEVSKLFSQTSNDNYGVSVHDLKSISRFKEGVIYKVVCHPHMGTVEIVME